MEKIERVEDQDKLLIQNSIKYLNSLTKINELNVPTLKSLYRTKCRLMELRRHIYLPQEKPSYRCQRCFINFSEGPTKYEVKPMKLSHFAKTVVRKVKNKRLLTRFQKMYYRKLKKKFPNGFEKQNKLVITCNFCKKRSEIGMTKPKIIPTSVKKSVTSVRKKKKSKKDKLCGLNENAVTQSASKKRIQNNLTQNKIFVKSTSEFVTRKSNPLMNASVSLTNMRVFETADFIPLENGIRKEKRIKFSRKSEKPQLKVISKSQEKLQKKNLKNLSIILKKANENKNRQSSSLKHFLAGL